MDAYQAKQLRTQRLIILSGYYREIQIQNDMIPLPPGIIEECDKFYFENIHDTVQFLKDCKIIHYPTDNQLQDRLIPTPIEDVQDRMWLIHDKTGLPGTVSALHLNENGTFEYTMRMPHTGRSAFVTHIAGDIVYRPVMKLVEYLVSYLEGDHVFCFDANKKEIVFRYTENSKMRMRHWRDNVIDMMDNIKNEQKKGDVFVQMLEGPMKHGKYIRILQILHDAKLYEKNI
eukprot:494480_1